MKLAASLIVRNELGRYLEPCIDHLLEFCDIVAILDDGSEDGFPAALASYRRSDRVRVHLDTWESQFFKHEGAARQRLLEFTLAQTPTHVLAIDADEFVSDGAALRGAIVTRPRDDIFMLEIAEVWRAFDECLCIRQDGGWREHPIPALWRVPPDAGDLRIADRALACGRVPVTVDRRAGRSSPTGVQLLHFGWANEAQRPARHERYAVADGGRFHRSAHLDSILWPNEKVTMDGRPWPSSLEPVRAQILDYATGVAA